MATGGPKYVVPPDGSVNRSGIVGRDGATLLASSLVVLVFVVLVDAAVEAVRARLLPRQYDRHHHRGQ